MSSACPSSLDLALPLGSAPAWTLTITESDGSALVGGLSGAELWFAVKARASDPDSAALIFASTLDGNIVVTDTASARVQISLTEAQTARTASLMPNRGYPAFLKIRLSDNSTWLISGRVTTSEEGIQAP